MNFSRTFGIIVSIFLLGAVAAYSETGTPSITNGDIKTFTTAGDAAPATNVVAITGDATAVTSSGATLNGSINPGGGSLSVWFDWGASTSLGNRTEVKTILSGTTAVAVTFSLSKLQPNTVYYFRLDAYRSPGGAYSIGDIKTFTTSDAPVETTVTVTTGEASAITFNSATLNGKIKVGGRPFGAWFEYGTTPSLGTRTEAHTFSENTTIANLTHTLNDLHSNTTYYFRAVVYRRGANVLGVSQLSRRRTCLQRGQRPAKWNAAKSNPGIW